MPNVSYTRNSGSGGCTYQAPAAQLGAPELQARHQMRGVAPYCLASMVSKLDSYIDRDFKYAMQLIELHNSRSRLLRPTFLVELHRAFVRAQCSVQ